MCQKVKSHCWFWLGANLKSQAQEQRVCPTNQATAPAQQDHGTQRVWILRSINIIPSSLAHANIILNDARDYVLNGLCTLPIQERWLGTASEQSAL